ncbi:MAG: hypothetical protein CR974_03040 [Gammaproteobacteria bacterium]|nr:MAG: hypothetical protein CR974_03040 [Gammaproteobacteria bacterium]
MDFSAAISVIIETIILYPLFFGIVFALPILAILWVLLAKQRNWCRAKNPALLLALIAGVAAFFGLPLVFHSSLSDISYWVDWVFHGLCVFGVFVYVFLVTWFFIAPSRA